MAATLSTGRSLPAVRELPLVGSALIMRRDYLAFLDRVVAQCGDAGRFHFGPLPGVVFNAPDAARQVLVEQADAFDKGPLLRRAFRYIRNNGIFILEGEPHRRHRRIMAPPFQPRHLAAYAGDMVALTLRAQQRWSTGTTLDIQRAMMALTMSIVGKVIFDADVLDETDELGAAVTDTFRYLTYAALSLAPLPLWAPAPLNRRARRGLATVQRRLQSMIDERRASDLERRLDMLSMLIKARDEDGTPLGDAQIQDEAVQIFFAGHETSALTLAWCIYLLTLHPEIQARVQREVDQVLAGRPPAVEDLSRLPYALQVLKETLRLYPPGYVAIRRALRDVQIGDYLVRKGQVAMVSIYTLHRRPDNFPDPDYFDPDRFAPERERALPRYAFLPFGAGPHVCIGNHFALMETHLVLATLLQRLTFRLVPGQRIVPEVVFTLRQREGCRVIVERRAAL